MAPPKKGTEFQCPPKRHRTEGLVISIRTLGLIMVVIATLVGAIMTHEDRYAKTSEVILINKAILENQEAIRVLAQEIKEIKAVQTEQATQIARNQEAILKQLEVLIKMAEE